MSNLQDITATNCYLVRFEDFGAMTMKNAVFWDVTSCVSSYNRSSGGIYLLHHQKEQ
jgi:hypothetical protein